MTGNSALFKGDFKIVRNRPPNGSNKWELFNISDDPGETNNLANDMPEKLMELITAYDKYVETNGVIELPPDYNWADEMLTNTLKRNAGAIYQLAFLIFLILTVIAVIIFRRR